MTKSKTPKRVKVRRANAKDIPKLVELNRAAYPVLANENVVWGEAHLRAHQQIFPEGQMLAEVEGRIVGAISTLIVNLGSDPLRNHTWAGITDSGYFSSHDPARHQAVPPVSRRGEDRNARRSADRGDRGRGQPWRPAGRAAV